MAGKPITSVERKAAVFTSFESSPRNRNNNVQLRTHTFSYSVDTHQELLHGYEGSNPVNQEDQLKKEIGLRTSL